ncbi:universal stress protein [Mesobacillus selenatarsenatis]|uniref:Universal stress protein family n=1 Tax=Mesobacillus selenatarsenatis (strain DSM 18680 / JCM 14380 / FERM P-15431 / SF-1) TaxID=1321606 RepID=A0A0A8X604_MESS1|nr:universal stress protein [Mesobacillus selenatarsenatis]GAM15385.1 universal stress protein family [Mesobacillus selenatarsenatis SF-1]
MFKRILLASDGSDHSVRAAKKAVELAKLTGDSEITVVYVVDGQTSKEDVLHNTDRTVVEEKRKIRLQPVTNMLEEASLNFRYEKLLGEPGPSIVDYANKNQFDVVVLGSRGLNGLQEMVLGSVSHKVAKRVKAPVLIVK